jgi:hypothetical protein
MNNSIKSTALGILQCRTTPSGASITYDGYILPWVTPTDLDVDAGFHTVIYTLTGYESCTTTVNVPANGTAIVTCTLIAKPTYKCENGECVKRSCTIGTSGCYSNMNCDNSCTVIPCTSLFVSLSI